MELDHLFICCAPGAPEADRLAQCGIIEGASNRHPGQGTANRRFFFHNAFVELLWVDDSAEAQSAAVCRTRLWERWSQRGRGASPFGIALRPAVPGSREVPFPTWEYRPPYLPDPLVIHMGTNSEELAEPLLFYIGFGRRADSFEPAGRQPLSHATGWQAITRLRVTCQGSGEPSPALRAVEHQCAWLSCGFGGEDLLEIFFDDERAGERLDLRPVLPVIFRW